MAWEGNFQPRAGSTARTEKKAHTKNSGHLNYRGSYYHQVCEPAAVNVIQIAKIDMKDNLADIFTKPFPAALLHYHLSYISSRTWVVWGPFEKGLFY
jgi:hypothetical protein